jgi:hypothetical protein
MDAPISAAPPPTPAAPSAATSYDLYFVRDGQRVFWRNPNRGIALVDDGRNSAIVWTSGSGEGRALWTDIVAVSMNSANVGRSEIKSCRIRFRDGRMLTATNAGAYGTLDQSRTPIYCDFVRALHQRLARAPEGLIAFTAGVTEGRYLAMKIVFAIAAAFFVLLPLVLALVIGDWRVLGTLAAGAALVWPLWRSIQNNAPRRYDPHRPPEYLLA